MDPENCVVCLDILYEPHHALPCQHLFCKLCFKQLEHLGLVCPYCRQDIKKWKYNRKKADQVRKAHPAQYKEKIKEEKKQKLIKKKPMMDMSALSISLFQFWQAFLLTTVSTDLVMFGILFVSFWVFEKPMMDLYICYMGLAIWNIFLLGITVLIHFCHSPLRTWFEIQNHALLLLFILRLEFIDFLTKLYFLFYSISNSTHHFFSNFPGHTFLLADFQNEKKWQKKKKMFILLSGTFVIFLTQPRTSLSAKTPVTTEIDRSLTVWRQKHGKIWKSTTNLWIIFVCSFSCHWSYFCLEFGSG